MTEETKDQRVTVMMSRSDVQAIDTYQHQSQISSRGEAIRRLIKTGLAAAGYASPAAEQAPTRPYQPTRT